MHVELHKIAVAFFGQLSVRRRNAHVDIPARQVEIAQHLLVGLDAFGHKSVAFDQSAEQPRLLGPQHAAQTTVRILAVADKAQAFNLDVVAFEDFKHQINAVLVAADDLGLDAGGDTAVVAIGLRDGIGVFFGLGRVKDAAFV